MKDPVSGEWQGIYIDLARALAQRLGVPITFVEYPTIVERDASAAAGAWDITTDSRRPEEAAVLGWSAAIPYLDTDNTLVVGPNSSIRSIADMDRPGIRIGALSGTGPERNLSGLVKQAEVVRTATVAELVPLLRAGQVDALVSNRSIVLAFAAQVPGARVLADRYAVTQNRLMLAPGRAAASLALASEVTRQALASGLIRTSIARAGIVGVQPAAAVAPGGLPRTGGPPRPPAGVAGAGLVAAAVGLLAARQRRSRAR
jgi:polar amino acid transport system substrate-binding protein